MDGWATNAADPNADHSFSGSLKATVTGGLVGGATGGIGNGLGQLLVSRFGEGTLANALGKMLTDGGGGCNSFVAGTTVQLANGTSEPINSVKVGTTVLATDPLSGTTKPEKVTASIVTKTDTDFTDLTVHTPHGAVRITSTQHHPYWDVTRHLWVNAGDLHAGDRLRTASGSTVTVTAVRNYTAHHVTYNLTVDKLHTYYVLAGTTPILVHNCGGYFDGHDVSCACEGQPGNPVTLEAAPAPAPVAQSASSRFTSHALQRLSQRGVSPEEAEQVLGNQPFSYLHEDQWKTGFYDSGSKIFIAKTIDGNINTVMTNVEKGYINRLMGGR